MVLYGIVVFIDSFDLAVPWRKVRQFTDISESKTISFEILIESKAFTWVEFKTIQGTYLLQLVAEYIEVINSQNQTPEFKQPPWAEDGEKEPRKGITFKMIKDQFFSSGKKDKKEKSKNNTFYEEFDAIDVVSSNDEQSESDNDGDSDVDEEGLQSEMTSPLPNKNVISSTAAGPSSMDTSGPPKRSASYLSVNRSGCSMQTSPETLDDQEFELLGI